GRIRRPTEELGARRARRRPAAATLPPRQRCSHIPDPRRICRITGLPSWLEEARSGLLFGGSREVRSASASQSPAASVTQRRRRGEPLGRRVLKWLPVERRWVEHSSAIIEPQQLLVHYQKNQLLYGL
uniref:Uncharacterized protein n=1 Tax=Oryza nivara TaxID=4536 RepID=A0A0E0GND0_ORYNI